MMKHEDYTMTLRFTKEQYEQIKSGAEKYDVSVEGYALYKVLHEDAPVHSASAPKLLLTPAEACELLGIGRTTMYKLIHEGAVPAIKLPGCRKLFLSVDGLKQMIRDYTLSPSEIGGEDHE